MLVRFQDIELQWKGGLDRKVAKTDKYGFVGRRLAILGYFGDTNSFFHKSHRKAIMQLLVHPIMSLIQKCIPLKWVCIDYCLGLQTLSIFICILAGISFSFWALLSDDVLLNITFCEVSNSLGLPLCRLVNTSCKRCTTQDDHDQWRENPNPDLNLSQI